MDTTTGLNGLQALLQPLRTTRRMLWLALTAAIFLYVWVVYIRFGSTLSVPFPSSHPLTIALVGAALAVAVATRWIPAPILPERRVREMLAPDADPAALARNAQTGVVDTERLARIEMLSPDERRILSVAQASFTPFVLRLALNESIALFGFVLSSVLQQFWPIVPFAAAALLLNVFVSPRIDSGLGAQ